MKVRPNSGFTLVELLVVAAIIAILTTFAVPQITVTVASIRQTQVDHDLKVINVALERYYTERHSFPQKLDDLVVDGFLKPGTRFRSPVSNEWYLYAVDDNYDDHTRQAYILASGGRTLGPNQQLHHNLALPKGRRTDFPAYAWVAWKTGTQLVLYEEDDTTPLPESDYPATLANYLTYCDAHPGPQCTIYTN